MAKLVRRDTGEVHALPDGVTQIGRLSANDIQLMEREVSRSHCHVAGPAGGWVVVDHGSDLGTYVNGRRVRIRGLHHGDELKVGSTIFVFQDDPGTQTTESGVNLRPLTETTVDEILPPEIFPPEGPKPLPRRTLYVLIGAGVVVAMLLVSATVALTRPTPQRVVRRAAQRLSRRDVEGLWTMLSAERREQMGRQAFALRLRTLPEPVLAAAAEADVRPGAEIEGGVAVPVALEVEGRRVADEVILRREDGAWRIHDAPVPRLPELLGAEAASRTP